MTTILLIYFLCHFGTWKQGIIAPTYACRDVFIFPLFSFWVGYKSISKCKFNLHGIREIPCIWTIYALPLQKISVMLTAHISAYFPWPVLLLTMPSSFHSCYCLRISLRSAPCHGTQEKRKASASCSQHSLTHPSWANPMQGNWCALCGDQPCPCLILEEANQLQDLALWGSPATLAQEHLPTQQGWCEKFDASSRLSKAGIFLLPVHICHPLSPRFLSSPAPALQVSWLSAKIIQLANPANNNFHFSHLQLSVSAAVEPIAYWVRQAPVLGCSEGRDPAAEREGSGSQGVAVSSPRAGNCSGNCWVCPSVPPGLGMGATNHPVESASHSGSPDLK